MRELAFVTENGHVANFLERRDDQANAKPCSLCAAFSSKVRVAEHPLQIPGMHQRPHVLNSIAEVQQFVNPELLNLSCNRPYLMSNSAKEFLKQLYLLRQRPTLT